MTATMAVAVDREADVTEQDTAGASLPADKTIRSCLVRRPELTCRIEGKGFSPRGARNLDGDTTLC